MAFEKFYRSEVQEKLHKMSRKNVKKSDDIRTFDELINSLEIAENRIIELEKQLRAVKAAKIANSVDTFPSHPHDNIFLKDFGVE